jgi:hypothetical protein
LRQLTAWVSVVALPLMFSALRIGSYRGFEKYQRVYIGNLND